MNTETWVGLAFVPVILAVLSLASQSLEAVAIALGQGMRGEEISAQAPTAEEWLHTTQPLAPLIDQALQAGNTSEEPLP